jgi:hypothetical protein
VSVTVERHLHAVVTHAGLDRLRVRTLCNGQGDGGMAKVVKSQTVETHLLNRPTPVVAVEARRADWLTGLIREDEPVRPWERSCCQLMVEHVYEERRDADLAPAGLRLRRLPDRVVVESHELLDDGDAAGEEIHTAAFQSDQLTPPKAGIGGHVDQDAKLWTDRLGQLLDLSRRQEPHLR